MLDKEEIKKIYNGYYNEVSVMFEMVKVMRGRECALLGKDCPPIRCMKIHNLSFLRSNFDAFQFHDRLYNVYGSLASLDGMPLFSYNPPERKRQQLMFNKEFNKYVTGYEVPFDFDCDKEDNMKAIWDMKDCIDLLNQYKIPHYCKISGTGGHLGIPSFVTKFMNDNVVEIPKTANLMAKILKDLMDFETLDASIYEIRRIWKIDYSLDIKSGNVALPLNSKQIKDFNWDMVVADKVLQDGVRDRGRILQNECADENKCKERITKFMNEVIYGDK